MGFERNEKNFIKQQARDLIKPPRIGRVVQVYEHIAADDNSNFEADVILDDGTHQERVRPMLGPYPNAIAVPRVGDKVIIEYLGGAQALPVLSRTVYTNDRRAPIGRAGMYRNLFESPDSPTGSGDLYFTGHTVYDDTPAANDYIDLAAQKAYYQVAKLTDPTDRDSWVTGFEVFDSTTESYVEARATPTGEEPISIKLDGGLGELNVDGGEGLINITTTPASGNDITVEIDADAESMKISGGSGEAGISIDFSAGGFKLLDQSGRGFVSDGSGNITVHETSFNFSEGTSTTL